VTSPAASGQGYNSSTRTYSFRNIANLLNYHLTVSPDEDLRMLVVPVNRVYETYSDNSYYSSSSATYYTTAINPYLAPSGLKLRKDNMQVVILSSQFTGKPEAD
jgi:vacuolar-type H+-ATPase subunit C/Vma6